MEIFNKVKVLPPFYQDNLLIGGPPSHFSKLIADLYLQESLQMEI